MRLLERIAYTSMARGEHPVAFASRTRRIQFHFHQLVHILQHQHVTVELNYPVILFQRERRQLTPAIIEARVVGVVLLDRRQQVLDMLLGNAALIEGLVAFGREGVGV
jgi:hypothetical protein